MESVEVTEAEPRARDWSRIDSFTIAAITLVAGILRFVRLDLPKKLVFDEIYYAKDACFYVDPTSAACETASEITGVHPPLGKWILAIGVRIFGYDSFGWRFMAAVAGTITVALVYLLARKLLRSTLGASLASGLMAIDLLHFVQSRIAMLDIFVCLFGVAAFLFLVYDRDRLLHETETKNRLLDRPWRLLAGLAAGASTASKWSGAFFVVAIVVVSVVWEISARTRDGRGHALGRFVREEVPSIVLWLVVAPIAVYVLTFIGRIQDTTLFASPLADDSWLRAAWQKQVDMLDFHSGLPSTHSYQSPPWSWPLLKRPVAYEFTSHDNGDYQEIFASGNPFVWWSALLALVYATFGWFRGRRWGRPEGLILAGFGFAYVPWLLLDIPTDRSAVFMFYFLPAIPFMCLALGYIVTKLGSTWEAKAAIGLFTVGSIGLFAFYYPLAANVPIPQPAWQKRIWVFDECDKPPGPVTTVTTTETRTGGAEIIRTSTSNDNSSIPPTGWCWI